MSDREQSAVKSIRSEAGAQVVALAGDVDLQASPAVHRAIAEVTRHKPAILVIDLSDVPYMDSSGVGTMVEVLRRVQNYGGKMALAAPTPQVRSLFQITQLERIFTIFETLDEALSQ